MHKFSVIIPVYNVAPYLRACLDSVIVAVLELEKRGGEKRWAKEECPLVEVICVDDGSTDASGEILDEYAERVNSSSCEFEREPIAVENKGKTSAVHLHLFSPPIFRVLHQQNAGVSAARNAALEVASGEWIRFVDSDDLVSVDYFSDIIRAINEFPTAEMIGFGKNMFETQSLFASEGAGRVRMVDVRKFVSEDIVNRGFWQFAYKRELIEGMRFPPYAYGEDLVWRCEALSRAKEVAIVDSCLYGYRQRAGSAMTKGSTPQDTRNVLKVREQMFMAFQNAGKSIPSSFARGYGNAWIERTPYVIHMHRKDSEWDGVWEAWLDSLVFARQITSFSLWMRFVAWSVSLTRSMILSYAFCVFPHYLKIIGLHR